MVFTVDWEVTFFVSLNEKEISGNLQSGWEVMFSFSLNEKKISGNLQSG